MSATAQLLTRFPEDNLAESFNRQHGNNSDGALFYGDADRLLPLAMAHIGPRFTPIEPTEAALEVSTALRCSTFNTTVFASLDHASQEFQILAAWHPGGSRLLLYVANGERQGFRVIPL